MSNNMKKIIRLFSIFVLLFSIVYIHMTRNSTDQTIVNAEYIFEEPENIANIDSFIAKYDRFLKDVNYSGVNYEVTNTNKTYILNLRRSYDRIYNISCIAFFMTPKTTTGSSSTDRFIINTIHKTDGSIYLLDDKRDGYINYSDPKEIQSITLSIEVPYKILEHNADSINEETHELIWNLKLGEKNDIVLNTVEYHYNLILGILIILLFLVVVLTVRKR